jgi:hypothetical protein
MEPQDRHEKAPHGGEGHEQADDELHPLRVGGYGPPARGDSPTGQKVGYRGFPTGPQDSPSATQATGAACCRLAPLSLVDPSRAGLATRRTTVRMTKSEGSL